MYSSRDGTVPFEMRSTYCRALHEYTVSGDDPSELPFVKEEILDVNTLSMEGTWWEARKARKADGSVGIVPSNFLVDATLSPVVWGAVGAYQFQRSIPTSQTHTVLHAMNELSFKKDEVLDILLVARGDRWRARKQDGTVSNTPSGDHPDELSLTTGEILHVVELNHTGWWDARKSDGWTGIAPFNYLQILPNKSGA
ncbi:hypothetical protein DFH07DRAFT_768448 [Mycena maculata]|uniref:SH3 domain-containing protein n=1 Tax=Mycena maculata TaxID=230809 RepID=A0AAD7NR43_9AGAR|nr:hypothetical protein DFH07DRAFT_768448 [Mycena maculata]